MATPYLTLGTASGSSGSTVSVPLTFANGKGATGAGATNPQNIPTLSEWGLMLLTLVLGLVAVRASRKQE